MKVAVVGVGYVGLPTGVGLAQSGHDVIMVARTKSKIDNINKGKPPIFEKDLDDMLAAVVRGGKLKATTDLEVAVEKSEVTIICVGTPSQDDGSIDLSHVEDVAATIGKSLGKKKSYHVVVMKSTVIPGTTERVLIPLLEKHSKKKAGKDFGVAMNPEFLREGVALDDFLNPDRIVIGCIDDRSGEIVEELYSTFKCPILRTKINTAEMIKYTSNSLLAAKISFINEVGNICKRLGVDVYEVAAGVGLDHRIGPHFLKAGPGFGGSCFPKDVSALVHVAKTVGVEPLFLQSILDVNHNQPLVFIDLVKRKTKLKDKRVAVLGLAFKAGTDDMRYSPAIPIVNALLDEGATVVAYDPKAVETAKKIFGDKIKYVDSAQKALKDADLALIVTDWKEFESLNYSVMKTLLIFDSRRIVNKNLLPKNAEYHGLCW